MSKKECLSATVASHLDASVIVEVVSNEAVPINASLALDTLKSNSTLPSLPEVPLNSNGVAEVTEEAVPCLSETKRSDSVATSMSPETSPQMAPFTDTGAQPAAASTVPVPLPGATITPQHVLPVVQSTPLPNGEAGAEVTAQPSTSGDPATDAILKALTPHIQHLFNLKTFMNHPQIKDHLDGELYVTASQLLQIPEFQAITSSMELLTQALRNDPIDVEFDDNGNRIRCRNKRNVVIVRELSNTENTKEDIKTIFDCDDGSCPEVLHVEYANFSCWYIYFACENDAVTSLGFLNERRFKGRSVQAGIKSSQPTARVPYTPVKPNLPNGMGGSMPAQHQGPGNIGGQNLVVGGPPPPGGMYVGRPLPTSTSGVMPQQQQAPVAAGSGNSCAAPSAPLMYSPHNSAVMHNAAAAAAAAAAIYPSHYYNLPQPALFYPSPMMQHYNPTHGAFMDLGQFVTFNGLNPTSTYKPAGATQLQRFSSNVNLNNNGNKSRNRSRDSGQRTPASSAGPPTPQGGGGSSVHATYVPQPNPRLFGPPQSSASPSGGLQQQPLPYTSQPSHNTNNSTLHYTNAYHAHMPPSFHHHHHHHPQQQQQHPVVSMAASALPSASSANTSSAPSTTFQQQESTNGVPSQHINSSSNSSANNNSCAPNSNQNSNSLANQYSSNTTLISSSISNTNNNSNNNSNNANSPNSAPSPTSSSSLLREDSARSSPVHINNSRNKTSNTPPLLPCSSINNNSSSEGRSHNPSAPLISHPPLICQENAPLMAIPPQALHANSQNMPQHRNKYNNNMHFSSHHNNQRAQYAGQPGNMHHRNYPPYIYGQPNHYPMARDNMPARPMGRSNGGSGGGGGNGGRSNRGRQQRTRDDDGHYHQMSGGGNSGGQMSGSHHQQQLPQGSSGGPPPRMGGAPGGRSSTGGAGGGSGGNSANSNPASGGGNSQQSIHPSNDNASNSPSNNNVSNSNSRGNNLNSSRNQQLDRAAQHSSHDSKQAQFALESTSFPPLPGADESEPSPSTATDETAPAVVVVQVASQAVASESVTTPRANFAWGSDVSSTTNGQRFSDIMKKPRSEVVPLTAASSACTSSSKPDESTAGFISSSSLDAALSLPAASDVAPAVVTAATIVANSNASAAVACELAKSSSNSAAAEVVACSPTTSVDSSIMVGAGSAASKSTSTAAKDHQSLDAAASNRQGNNGAGGKEQRARGGRNRRGENAQQQQQQSKTFNKNGSTGNAATGPLGKSQQPKQSSGNVQTLAPAKATNIPASTSTTSCCVPASISSSNDASSTAAPATTAPATAYKAEKEPEAGNKELGDDDGWITKKTKEPRSHRNERKNAGMGHNSHRGGYSSSDYHSERREERAYYGRGQMPYKERDTNRDSGSERQQPMLNGNTSPPPTQRQTSASSTAPSKGKPVKSNIEAEAVKPSVNAKDSSSVSQSAVAPASVASPTPSAPATSTAPSTASTVVASPPAEAGEHVKTWANVAGQGSKKIVHTAAVQSQLERKSKDLAMQEKEKERRAASVRVPRGGGVSRGSERGGYSGRGVGGGRGGNGFVGSTSVGRGQRRPDFRPGEHQGSSYRGGRGGGERGAYNRDNKDDHQPTDAAAMREPVQYRDNQSASSSTTTPVTATPAAARAK